MGHILLLMSGIIWLVFLLFLSRDYVEMGLELYRDFLEREVLRRSLSCRLDLRMLCFYIWLLRMKFVSDSRVSWIFFYSIGGESRKMLFFVLIELIWPSRLSAVPSAWFWTIDESSWFYSWSNFSLAFLI